jgi:peroxiredoxin
MANLLPVGMSAPDFALPATAEQTVALGDYAGQKNVVLVFYVDDNTPD